MRHPLRWAAAAGLTATVLLIASLVPFLWPPHDKLGRFDAVLVLSGDRGERLDRALELVKHQPSAVLVLDGAPDIARSIALCDGHAALQVVCLRPQPDNTRGEARAAAQLARERGWRQLVVVTSTPHVTRARLLFRRCVEGSVVGVAASPPYSFDNWVGAVIHDWLGTAQALTTARSC